MTSANGSSGRTSRVGPAVGVWQWNPGGGTNVLSPELHDMFGTEANDPERSAVWAVRVHPSDWPMVQAEMEAGIRIGRVEFEYRYLHPQHGLRWFYCKGGRLRPDDELLFGVVVDVTERKRDDEALQRVQDELEWRIKERTAELARTNEDLRRSEERFRMLVEGVQDYAIFMLDPTGCILSWNSGAQRMKGYRTEEIIGRHFSIFYPPEDRLLERLERQLQTAVATGRFEGEGWRVRKDGSRFWANVLITALFDHGVLLGFAKVTRDITAHKEAKELAEERNAELLRINEALRQSEERFRLVIEGVQDYAIFMLDTDGCVLSWNAGAQRIKGYEHDEIIGRHFSVFYPAEDVAAGKPARGLGVAVAKGRFEDEGWRVRKDGSRFWANVLVTALYDHGVLRGFAKVTRDITERRKSEQAVRELSGRLLQIQDEERRRFARELHDSTGQILSALSLNLILVKQHARFDEHSQAAVALSESVALADQACREMRTLSYLMHPPLLDEAGLNHTLRWYIEGFTQRTGINVSVVLLPESERLARDLELALFRIVQEGLANIHRHSASNAADIRLTCKDNRVVLEMRDYGKGLPTDISSRINGGLANIGVGLRGMGERARQLGGHVEFMTADPGALLRVVLPYRAVQAMDAAPVHQGR